MIKTQRLVLRPLEDNDAKILSEIANNKKIWENLTDAFPHPYTLENAREWINYNKEKVVPEQFLISDESGPVGMIGFSKKDDYCEFGYWLAEHSWGKGYATEAVREFVNFVFNNYEFSEIRANVFTYNPASAKVLEKCGFEKQKELLKIVKAGKEIDEYLFILKKKF